jgi:YidC/Oxa1 family membrane protein insertase
MNKVFYLLIMASLLPVLIFAYPAMTVTATNGGVVVLSDLYNITVASSGITNYKLAFSQYRKELPLLGDENSLFKLPFIFKGQELKSIEINGKIAKPGFEYKTKKGPETVTITFNYLKGKVIYKFYNDASYRFDVEDFGIRNYAKLKFDSKNFYINPKKGKSAQQLLIIQQKISKDKTSYLMFFGPKRLHSVKNIFNAANYNYIVEKLKLDGFYTWKDSIFYPFVGLLYWLYKITGNYGWALIIFATLIRVLLHPMYKKQIESMEEMKFLAPHIQEIKKKYPGDTKRLNEETAKLYKKYNINPSAGCLTMAVQLPILFLLYAVIRYFGESYTFSPTFLIWDNLGAGGLAVNWVQLIIYIGISYFQTIFTTGDKAQRNQSLLMMLMFSFLFISFPSGLFIYWNTTSAISLIQTIFILKSYRSKKSKFQDININKI